MKDRGISGDTLDRFIETAIAEDLSGGDITTDALIPPDLSASAELLVKATGVLAGIEIASRIFERIDPGLRCEVFIPDGRWIKPGEIVAAVTGRASSILKGERTALNILQRLSGIATMTAQFVVQVQGTGAVIKDTRKTTPGLRTLEKYAVRMGGGQNHRFNLGDAVLIKDNHLMLLGKLGVGIKEVIARVRHKVPAGIVVEIEVNNVSGAADAAAAGVDIILLDNMSSAEMAEAVKQVNGRAKVEASGGITLENVREIALTGVDIISVGALTHSPRALDVSLEINSI